jgi:SseB protein N-terminal domain
MIAADHSGAGHAGEHAEDAMERALAEAARDSSKLGDLLDELSRGRLWLPLPEDGRPVTDGTDVRLPTLTYLGAEFVPGFTSAARLRGTVPRPRAPLPPALGMPGARGASGVSGVSGVHALPPIKPHIVVPVAALARLLPADVGIALNPGAGESVPVYPEGVAYLASVPAPDPHGRVSVGPPPVQPDGLLDGIRSGLAGVPAASQAAAAWLAVEFAGEGLVISVTLDDPDDGDAKDAVVSVVERAAQAAPTDPLFPIDVTFPGEYGRGEASTPDPVDEWVSACATPFYRRG